MSAQRTIQHFPDDILHLIFQHSLPSEFDTDESDILSISPMSLALVCHSWRTVVMEYSSLWSVFEVDMEANNPSNRCFAQLIKIWLRHSSSSLLSFRVNITLRDASDDSVLEKIASQLLSQSHRWKVVELNVGCGPVASFLREINLSSAVSLTSLYIGDQNEVYFPKREPEEKMVVALDLSQSRHLKTLSLSFRAKLRLLGREPVHLDSLSYLCIHIDSFIFEDFWKLLRAANNLQTLKATFIGRTPPVRNIHCNGSIYLANLTEMGLVDANRELLTQFLGWLECPMLDTFTVDDTYMAYEATSDLLHALDEFFRRSHPPVKRLRLDWFRSGSTIPASLHGEYKVILRQILARLRDVELLWLEGFVVDDSLFQDMTFGLEENKIAVLCPSLSYLNLQSHAHNIALRVLEDFIESRWKRTGNALRRLNLGFWHGDERESLAKLKESSVVKQCILEGFSLLC